VTRLRSELVLALDEVERQQRLRSEAEEQARRIATSPSPSAGAAASAAPAPGRRALWILLELASVAAAAVLFLIVLGSAYAAVVAGLTTGAVVLALDSLYAVRSRGDALERGTASVTLLRAPRG